MRRQYAFKALGVVVCLMGTFLMATDESILGAEHNGIAIAVGIIGLGIIARTRRMIP